MSATIKSRLTLGLGFLFLIILLLSGVGTYFLYQISHSTEATLRNNYRSVAYARQLADALADLRDARLSAGPNAAPAAAQARRAFEQALAAEQRNITEPGEGRLADSLATGFGQYLAPGAAPAALQAGYRQLRRQTGRVATLNLRAIEQQSQRTRQIATRTITTLGLLAVVGILATFSFLFSFPDYVTKPVEELSSGIRRLAAGDYHQRLAPPAYQEFAAVASAFNDMAQKLEGYETAEGTLLIDTSGALEVVIPHRRPGATPAVPPVPAEQTRLLRQLREQIRQLTLTTETLLNGDNEPKA